MTFQVDTTEDSAENKAYESNRISDKRKEVLESLRKVVEQFDNKKQENVLEERDNASSEVLIEKIKELNQLLRRKY